ncbi:methionyl-tRNA formyltransferase [Streptomyces sp. NPDC054784]
MANVAVLSYSADGFAAVHDACAALGHVPVVYAHSRSLRPRRPARAPGDVADIVAGIPAGTDLLLPADADGLTRALSAYDLDLLICNGFSWRLPRALLDLPRHGALNVHTSLLPRHRGPLPLHWAIRDGDPETGVTVHRMAETFDTGPVLARRGGVTLADEIDPDALFRELAEVTGELLKDAVPRALDGDPGEPQDESAASYAGWMEREFSLVDWSAPRLRTHHQVRTFRFGVPGPPGPVARVGGEWRALLRTRTEPGAGVRVECGDGPLWIVESVPTEPPDHW